MHRSFLLSRIFNINVVFRARRSFPRCHVSMTRRMRRRKKMTMIKVLRLIRIGQMMARRITMRMKMWYALILFSPFDTPIISNNFVSIDICFCILIKYHSVSQIFFCVFLFFFLFFLFLFPFGLKSVVSSGNVRACTGKDSSGANRTMMGHGVAVNTYRRLSATLPKRYFNFHIIMIVPVFSRLSTVFF